MVIPVRSRVPRVNRSWRDAKTGQSISERSVVFSVIVPGDASEARSKLDAMGLAYVRRFSQQAVMRTAAPVCVAF